MVERTLGKGEVESSILSRGTIPRKAHKMHIYKNKEIDRKAIDGLYPLAFPNEDLLSLLNDLLDHPDTVLSLGAKNEQGNLTGHAIITFCTIKDCNTKVALLGPIAVHPKVQKQGIGSALIYKSFEYIKEEDGIEVYVLGDPAYYSRFGFAQCGHTTPPYEIPQEWAPAWQFKALQDKAQTVQGQLSVPKPWRKPKLWA